MYSGFLRCFRDPIRALDLKTGSLKSEKIIKGNIWKDSRKLFRSLQVHTGFLKFSLKTLMY